MSFSQPYAYPPRRPSRYVEEALETALDNLPALPQSVMKVVLETNRPDPSALKVEEFIGSDQSLAAKLLRVVNSSYYGLSRQIGAVGQAIVILGLQQVRNLALSVGAVSTFDARTPKQKDVLKLFWMHAFASATATQIVARRRSIHGRSAEVMFVGALLHDIGRLFLFCHFPDLYDDVLTSCAERGLTVQEAEQEVFGIDHAQVGYKMAVKWHLPDILCDMIRSHEGPFSGSEDVLIYGVHAADGFTKHLYYGDCARAEIQLDPTASSWLNQPEDEIRRMLVELDERMDEARQAYGLMAA